MRAKPLRIPLGLLRSRLGKEEDWGTPAIPRACTPGYASGLRPYLPCLAFLPTGLQ